MAAARNTYNHKLVLLGDTGVGKSCFAMRAVRDRFDENQEPTIGGECGSDSQTPAAACLSPYAP